MIERHVEVDVTDATVPAHKAERAMKFSMRNAPAADIQLFSLLCSEAASSSQVRVSSVMHEAYKCASIAQYHATLVNLYIYYDTLMSRQPLTCA